MTGLRGRLVAAPLVLAVLGTVVGAAASLALTTTTLGSASTDTPRCTTDPLTVLPVLTASTVTSVTVTSVPSSCGGATLKVTVRGGATAGSGSLVVPLIGGSVTIPITGGPALTAAVETDLVLEGP